MIISVPHSGTRSLMDYLGYANYQHFGVSGDYPDNADIPIRNPIAVARSWDSRYTPDGSHTVGDMLDSFEDMMDYIYVSTAVLWKMEDYPVLSRSKGPERKAGPRVDAMKAWLKGDKLWFFQQYYDLDELDGRSG